MITLGPKAAILGPQFCRILVLGPQFWWSRAPPDPPLRSEVYVIQLATANMTFTVKCTCVLLLNRMQI